MVFCWFYSNTAVINGVKMLTFRAFFRQTNFYSSVHQSGLGAKPPRIGSQAAGRQMDTWVSLSSGLPAENPDLRAFREGLDYCTLPGLVECRPGIHAPWDHGTQRSCVPPLDLPRWSGTFYYGSNTYIQDSLGQGIGVLYQRPYKITKTLWQTEIHVIQMKRLNSSLLN